MRQPGSGSLRLLADDLTGALDSAAPFASPEAPVTVLLGIIPDQPPPRCAFSTASRGLSRSQAVAAVGRAAARLMSGTGPDTLWFKKVDSVLRGHPFDETAALLRLLGTADCIFAPAFPAEGRRTVGGWQGVVRDGGWSPLPKGDLRAGLSRAGVAGAVVPDAETQDDLARSIAPWIGRRDLLWAGARGLAEALAGARACLAGPAVCDIVIGTTHPATRVQAAHLGGSRPDLGVHDLAAGCADPAATLAAVRALFAGVAPSGGLRAGGALLVVGGDTLTAALDAAGARAVEVQGEVAPGIPCGRIVEGHLSGRQIVTKSGGFGAPDCLARLAAAT